MDDYRTKTSRVEVVWPDSVRALPSIAEQMGVDPISKLAAAIHDLADALRNDGGSAG